MGDTQIDVAVSDKMESVLATGSSKENRKVRLSEKTMEILNYNVGDLVQMRDKWGGLVCLIVDNAFKEDIDLDEKPCMYVTRKNFNKAFVKNKSMGISPVTDITLGCDPEAFIINSVGGLVGAFKFFKKVGQVGHDGMLLEFRPSPSISEHVVTSNLYNLILQARESLNSYPEGRSLRIISVSSIGKVSAGFHLHYGLPNRLLGFSSEAKLMASIITRALDFYVGVPAIIPEGSHDSTRRTLPYIDYGKPGQFRLDGRTFEYRMPGGVNLKHPTLTRGLLALGAVAVEDVVSRIKEATENFSKMSAVSSDMHLREIYPNLPDGQTMYTIICNSTIAMAKEYLKIIMNDVRKMIGYRSKAEAVEAYFRCLEAETKFNDNLEINWGGFVDEK